MPEPIPPPAPPPTDPASFAYAAQGHDGRPITGTVDAANLDDANARLRSLQLRVTRIAPVARPPKVRPVRGEDFVAFNEQLAQLARAGLPVEDGLRLIAEDLGRGRLAEVTRAVAAELESGRPLGEVLAQHRGQFPPLYGRLVEAGVRANNLPAMLFSLGRHMELVRRLRAALWRAAAYPLMVLAALFFVVFFLGLYVLPQFRGIYQNFGAELPWSTKLLLDFSDIAPTLAITLIAIVGAATLTWVILKATRRDAAVERLAFPLPFIGPILKRNLLARWCDALQVAIAAGMDLPAAIELAGDATRSPRLRADSLALAASISSGQPLALTTTTAPLPTPARRPLLPPTINAAIALGSSNGDLPGVVGGIAEMYERQAELRVAALPGVLTPILMVLVAIAIGFVILAMFAPMISIVWAVSGGHH